MKKTEHGSIYRKFDGKIFHLHRIREKKSLANKDVKNLKEDGCLYRIEKKTYKHPSRTFFRVFAKKK